MTLTQWNTMYQYLDLLHKIHVDGKPSGDRTGTGTRRVFGLRFEHNCQDGFPLLTTKKLHWKSVVYELLWFLRGDTNIKYLNDNGVRIWDEWANTEGSVGPCYGYQWRHWHHDQIAKVIFDIQNNPESRRLIVSAWNVEQIDEMGLPPCHMFFQFFVEDGGLSLQMYQRSADVFLGVPFNIASYALLLHMIAHVCQLRADRLIIVFGDIHIYNNHAQQVITQLSREPRTLPTLGITRPVPNIDAFKFEDFEIVGYDPHPHIAGKVSV